MEAAFGLRLNFSGSSGGGSGGVAAFTGGGGPSLGDSNGGGSLVGTGVVERCLLNTAGRESGSLLEAREGEVNRARVNGTLEAFNRDRERCRSA